MALVLCISSILILLLGFAGLLPSSISAAAVILSLILSITALLISRNQRAKGHIQILSLFAIVICGAIFAKSFYLHRSVHQLGLKHAAKIEQLKAIAESNSHP